MTELISTYDRNSKEYATLKTAADILTTLSKNGRKYKVRDCYFDFGQDWMWTTICYDSDWGGVQALCPRDYEKLLTYDNILVAIDEIVKDKYWND